jgi:hypothetical protein
MIDSNWWPIVQTDKQLVMDADVPMKVVAGHKLYLFIDQHEDDENPEQARRRDELE